MRPVLPDVDAVLALPATRTVTVPPEWGDFNDHVNVRSHYGFHMESSEDALVALGIAEGYRERHRRSVFSIEHRVCFHDEVLIGHELSAHFRLLDRSEKLMHAVTIMVNRTTRRIASSVEFVDAHVDLATRRACVFGPDLAAPLDALLEKHRRLDWEWPHSGSMGLRRDRTPDGSH